KRASAAATLSASDGGDDAAMVPAFAAEAEGTEAVSGAPREVRASSSARVQAEERTAASSREATTRPADGGERRRPPHT
ncbi:MAG TPA: hypothetical protein VFN38_03565, partial [Gemmatimonadaceae bacterium]|nr:hypothetical protein [Gemmatimonadaceae bacterium]